MSYFTQNESIVSKRNIMLYWGRFETSDWDHKLFRKLLIEVIHQVKTEVTFTQRAQTCNNQQLSLPGHKKEDYKFEILLFFPWLWLNLWGLCFPFLTISFNLCTFLVCGMRHFPEQQCVSYSHYKGNDVRGECLADREKSHACLSRYQVSLNEGFEVSLIISSHLSSCQQHVSSEASATLPVV